MTYYLVPVVAPADRFLHISRACSTSMALAGIFQSLASSGMVIVAAKVVAERRRVMSMKDSFFICVHELGCKGTTKNAHTQVERAINCKKIVHFFSTSRAPTSLRSPTSKLQLKNAAHPSARSHFFMRKSASPSCTTFILTIMSKLP